MKHKKIAFTLVELIIVITILAILGTIAFISVNSYVRDSRNSTRIANAGLIQTSLELYFLNRGRYPTPDDATSVTYSGGLLWTQGYVGEHVQRALGNLSTLPLDPLLEVNYNYSVFSGWNKYQLGLIQERSSLQLGSVIIPQAHALSNFDAQSHILGNYDLLDVTARVGTDCINVAIPSIFANNLPSDGVLAAGGAYDFVYNDGFLILDNYAAKMEIAISGFPFTISEVYNKCRVDDLSELNTYMVNLSSAYQQFNGLAAYDEVSNHPRTLKFIKKSILYLQTNSIVMPDSLVATLTNAMIDTFEGTDNDILAEDHVSDTLSDWEFISPSANSGSYIIFDDKLQKTNVSADLITPILLEPKTSSDTIASLKIIDFNGGSVVLYGRYQDMNNNYSVTVSNTGYIVRRTNGGVSTNLASVGTGIGNNSIIQLVLAGNNIKLVINGNELENRVDSSIPGIGKDVLFMDTTGVIVDDYILYFQ